MAKYSVALFIFRRDLRLVDNSALNQALKQARIVIPCFIFDPAQIESHPYQSAPGLQFMLQSLEDLQRQFAHIGARLNLCYGSPEKVIGQLCALEKLEAVFVNRDYTPFSIDRDKRMQQRCRELNVDFHSFNDALLTEPEQIGKSGGGPYQVFTPFYNTARHAPVPLPQALTATNFHPGLGEARQYDPKPLRDRRLNAAIQPGGRDAALNILDRLARFSDYPQQRDIPALAGTSRLSAHLKFGDCSVREVLHAVQTQLGPEHALIRQLYWRDFFTHIGFHFPRVFGHAFRQKYDAIVWPNKHEDFQAWCEGRTGFPIVDAGMRELKQTGYMHNRVRMITASFLVKDLHIDWRWGERHFARHLVDYDPCVNNGNWQWAASTGCDAQPYFRIFNPWRQQQKFDPQCRYIYRWLPELEKIPVEIIQRWDKKHGDGAYPKPIIDHKIASAYSKELFKNC
ncbi:deoxyribodipyrimidine photo-lyase [Methylomarinum sp. Ch1-1]|uniref:Deoxyribodipyrimidine photo-lyase n=1 Tax=Methylomarinum roseum TaxID=3067653 RepID=A0AAU7NWG5_9GAMM